MTNWYLNRLATMSVKEMPYRLRQIVQKNYEEFFSAGRRLPEIQFPPSHEILNIQCISNHPFPPEIDIFGKKFNYSENDIDWHKDIFSCKSFPLIFSKKINIRKVHNLSAKNVWEVNRLQFLPHISLNYCQTGDLKYLDQFIRITNSWIEANPYLTGVNWLSNIEINIRLINWFFCWEILNVSELIKENQLFNDFVTNKWIPAIYQHCIYSYKNPSRFSSANNHLIAEYSGLFIAASKWKFKESEIWLEYAGKGLEREIALQHSNGINREEAAEYIQFITDFFLLSYLVGENTSNQFSENFTQTLKKIFEYILAFIDINGNYPNYGDSDDGKVVRFSSEVDSNNFLSLLTSASVIFKDQRFKLKPTFWDLKNQIILGDKGKKIWDSLPENGVTRESHFYQNEGHFIFRNQQPGKEIYLHFNAAPLGYLSIAAHGHADALSFIMNINGYAVFVDPGTFSYHVSKRWREYFVSTMAHNTISIDGNNQADHIGDTMWLNHYDCRVVSAVRDEMVESVKAEHISRKSTRHLREISYDKTAETITIQDELFMPDDQNHEYILLYHLHPDIKIEKVSPGEFLLFHKTGIRLSIAFENIPASVINGRVSPALGWYSEAFLQKVPTNVIYAKRTINKSFKSITKILIHEY